MAVEGEALKGGLEPWMVEDRIKRGILKHCGSQVLAKLVPVYSGFFLSCICFRCTSDYTVAKQCILDRNVFYKGLMPRYDDRWRKSKL